MLWAALQWCPGSKELRPLAKRQEELRPKATEVSHWRWILQPIKLSDDQTMLTHQLQPHAEKTLSQNHPSQPIPDLCAP